MSVGAVVLDLDGTLIDEQTGRPVPGISAMMDALQAAGIRLAVASNRPATEEKLQRAGLHCDLVLDRQRVGVAKGSPLWVAKACESFELAPNQVVWLGDSDTDMRSAVNGRVIYFHAAWSVPNYPYGIRVSAPAAFTTVLRECFVKPLDWYWTFDQQDARGRQVMARALINGRGAGIPDLKDDLINFLKRGGDPRVGIFRARDFMMLHLLGSIYGEGLYRSVDVWTSYPGSQGGENPALIPVLNQLAKLFRDQYIRDLLVRHRAAEDSGDARIAGRSVDFGNQISTVHLNPSHRGRVSGRRVLVVDDFDTEGYSAECARNLLLEGAGASGVVCVGLGKYGFRRRVITPTSAYRWDPFVPTDHGVAADFLETIAYGTTDNEALTTVRGSYLRLAQIASSG